MSLELRDIDDQVGVQDRPGYDQLVDEPGFQRNLDGLFGEIDIAAIRSLEDAGDSCAPLVSRVAIQSGIISHLANRLPFLQSFHQRPDQRGMGSHPFFRRVGAQNIRLDDHSLSLPGKWKNFQDFFDHFPCLGVIPL